MNKEQLVKDLVKKSFEKSNSYFTVNDEKIFDYGFVIIQFVDTDQTRVTYTIKRKLNINKNSFHHIERTARTASEIACNLPGNSRSKFYTDNKSFEAAIKRITGLCSKDENFKIIQVK